MVPQADNWPQWRGPEGTGVTSERDLPVRWGPEQNVAWKTPIRGLGVSSPVVLGDRVIVTSQVGYAPLEAGVHPILIQGTGLADDNRAALGGQRSAQSDTLSFLVTAIDRSEGRLLWEYATESEGPRPSVHQKHNLASPSPVTDGERIYVWFGTGQLVALDMDGRVAWQRNLAREYSAFDIIWGHASSPVLHEDLVILLCDHEASSYLLAVDKRTGQERWRVDRGRGLRSYNTPAVVPGPRGDELLVNSSPRLDAYDPNTGELRWYAGEPNEFPTTVAIHHDGVVFTSRGHRSGPYIGRHAWWSRRRVRDARGVARPDRRALPLVAPLLRRTHLYGQRKRGRQLCQCQDGGPGLAGTGRWGFLRLTRRR